MTTFVRVMSWASKSSAAANNSSLERMVGVTVLPLETGAPGSAIGVNCNMPLYRLRVPAGRLMASPTAYSLVITPL